MKKILLFALLALSIHTAQAYADSGVRYEL